MNLSAPYLASVKFEETGGISGGNLYTIPCLHEYDITMKFGYKAVCCLLVSKNWNIQSPKRACFINCMISVSSFGPIARYYISKRHQERFTLWSNETYGFEGRNIACFAFSSTLNGNTFTHSSGNFF